MMRPSEILAQKRHLIAAVVGKYRTTNPRVFGSVLHGDDHEGSDIDILVDALPDATLFDLGNLQEELEQLLGTQVDVLTPYDLSLKFRNEVLMEAQPI